MHPRIVRASLLALLVSTLAIPCVRAQGGADLLDFADAKQLPIDSAVLRAARAAGNPALAAAGRDGGLPAADRGRVVVLLRHEAGIALTDAEWLATLGAEVTGSFANDLELAADPRRLLELAAALPAGVRLGHPGHFVGDAVEGEGPAVTGSLPYRDAGLNGSGLTIAVIDGGYSGLTAAQVAGDAPTGGALTTIDYTLGATFASGKAHGTGCTEAVYDHAPGANYRLYKISSEVDLGTAVADAIANGVDVITHSISWFNMGWGDDSGTACAAANAAAAAGILFFTSAGNRAEQHWEGPFDDGDGDGFHEWSGIDESLDITVPSGGQVYLYLSWDPGTGSKDYDLLLVDGTGGLLASSPAGSDTFESLAWTNFTSAPVTTRVRVQKVAGAATDLELFLYPGGVFFDFDEYAVAAGSATSPSNATHPNVIAVGAVDQGDFERPNRTAGIIMDYSSNGPSNDGMLQPDLVGPTNTAGTVYASFSGTSCATPNAAGFAAVLWSCDPSASAGDVFDRIVAWADQNRDFGFSGPDQVYGAGGCWLPPLADCNANSAEDICDILAGTSADANDNGVVDDFFCDSSDFVFRIPPVVEPFDFFDGSGTFWTRPEISEGPGVPGYPRPWAGFSLGIAHDPAAFGAAQVLPSVELMTLGGGQGPDFFAPELYAEGITVGCVFDFATQETFFFERAKAVAAIEYAPDAQTLAGSSSVFERDLTFSDSLGNPAVSTVAADALGNSIVPVKEGGIVELHPKSYFEFRVPAEVRVEVDPNDPNPPEFQFPATLKETREGPSVPVHGFTFALQFDNTVLEPTAVELGDWLWALNGGNGPTFLDLSIEDDHVFCAVQDATPFVVIALPAIWMTLTIPAPSGQGNPTDTWTNIRVGEVPGSPPIGPTVLLPNNVTAPLKGTSTLIDIIVLEPAEFVRADCNRSGTLNIADAIYALEALFILGTPQPGCRDACDANDDGVLNIGDPVFTLAHLFSGGAAPAAPFPTCGEDPTNDPLECDVPLVCP